jgi:predicted membrane channel-forming protein YqfA (hemolysin III family)
MFTRLRSVGFPAFNFQLCFEFVFEVILPIIGIVFELVNWKFARWVNVGCFIAAGCFWLMAAVWWRSDPFFGVLLITALGLLTVGGLTEIIYRSTRSDPADSA